MRFALASLSLIFIAGVPTLAHADTVQTYTVSNGILNDYTSISTYPAADGIGSPVGTVSGTIVFDATTDQFVSSTLSYFYTSTGATYTPGVTERTSSNFYGNNFYYTILGSPDGTFATGDAYIQIDPVDGHLCTLSLPCEGGNASNLNAAVDVPNIGSATVTEVTTVTPEPSSLMLLGTGILGVAGAARRRFRKA